jgi:hypothetical protein
MGRKRINHEEFMVRSPAGTGECIDAVLEKGEKQADFLREAVEREIRRRQKKREIATELKRRT